MAAGQMMMWRVLFRAMLVGSLVAVLLVASAAAASSDAAGLQKNPCAFLDSTSPGTLATTATFLAHSIGTYPSSPDLPPTVAIVTGAAVETGADFQDGVCTVLGKLGWYTGVVKPCLPPAANKTCDPAYVTVAVVTAPLIDAQQTIDAFGGGSYTVHTDLPNTGGHGTLACVRSRCVAWFTKGTKGVYIYNQNVQLPASRVMTLVAEAVYEHTTLWSTEKPPRGAG